MIAQSHWGHITFSSRAREIGLRILAVLFVFSLFLGGIQLRRLIGQNTRHVRYQHDIVNAFYWGQQTLKEARRLSSASASADSWTGFFRGYLALYDRVKEDAYESDYGLDYPPLRLLTMGIWSKQVRDGFPWVDNEHPKLVNPLLKINLFCELVSAAAVFFLVRSCMRRSLHAHSTWPAWLSTEHRASICGLAAASVAWLEPSMILNAHGWPQWDVWILPFYLFAALAALKNRWFWCGCLLALGAMFKGQLLFVTPFFLVWPLWQKRWIGALRILAGFTATAALVVSPWLLRTPAAWIAFVAVAGITLLFAVQYKLPHRGTWLAGILGAAAFVIGALSGGSFAWFEIGFLYGTKHYPYLFISSCYNLASLLAGAGWSLKDDLLSVHIGAVHFHLTMQWALRMLFLSSLVLCAYGAARHVRNRDPRVLIAITAPWLLMFALLGQMHERYLVWGAVVSAVALGVSVRLSIIHFIISAASTAMIVHVMLVDKKLDATLRAINVLHDIRPYASVLVLFCVAVYFLDGLGWRIPLFGRATAKTATTPSLSLGPEPEEA
ncbi:MAG: glycosyltransferase family 87 protein [Nitrospirota bacterium]